MDGFEIAFPDAAPGFASGKISRQDVVRIMHDAVLKAYPDCRYAFGHGSALNGNFGAFSDLDVIVFVPDGAFWEKRCVMQEGYAVEMTVYSLDTIDFMSFAAVHSGVFLGLCAGEGELIIDQCGDGHTLRQRFADLIADGPAEPSAAMRDRLRLRMQAAILDLRKDRSVAERILIGLQAYAGLSRAVTMVHRNWNYSHKSLISDPKAPERATLIQLNEAYAALHNGDHAPLADVATALLNELGGPIWDGFAARQSVRPDLMEAAQILMGLESDAG